MTVLTPRETQAVVELSTLLYNFLPGIAHPLSQVKTTFESVASIAGVGSYWPGGSKQPAVQHLLSSVLQFRREKFCGLMVNIIQEGLKYRQGKKNPITRDEIDNINALIARVGFKIPELFNIEFLASLPTSQKSPLVKKNAIDIKRLGVMSNAFLEINKYHPQKRGYAFEKFLIDLFNIYGFDPHPSFKIEGEQIDGSIEFDHEFYLIEAKWQAEPITESQLLVLDGRVSGHSGIGRGIFISISNFSPDGVAAYQRLRPPSMIGLDGQDLYLILEQRYSLYEVIRQKVRWLVETGEFYYPVVAFQWQLTRLS